MAKITLKSIKLQNWSSINSVVNFSDKRTKIMGANKIGKSSIINAWRWLLTSRVDAVHPANYELFDKRYELTPETPDAIVEATIVIDGCEYVLTRKAKAAFVKGVKAASDKYTTLIDGVEYTATQFNEWLESNIAPVAMLPFCIDGIFFATLCEEDKKKGRKVLEAIVGEITEKDFKGDYTIIADMLAKLPIEKVLEKAKADIAELDKSVERIPIEIEAKESVLASLNVCGDIEQEIEDKKKAIAEIDSQINSANDALATQRDAIYKEITSKELLLSECRNTHTSKQYALTSGIKAQIDEITSRNLGVDDRNKAKQRDFENNKTKLSLEKRTLDALNQQREVLLKKRDEIKARMFSDDKCAYCGQELPVEQLEKAKTKFLNEKTKDLDLIVLQGKNTKAQIEECEKRIKSLEEVIDNGVVLEEYESTNELIAQLKEVQDSFTAFEETKEYATINAEIATLKASLPTAPDLTPLIMQKQNLMQELQALIEKNGSKAQLNTLQNDIEMLREQLRNAGIEKALKLGVKAKCEEWIEERASIISNRINDRLKDCSIQMFSIQKNGEQVSDCVILDSNGVKYGKTNTAECLKINIELQKMFMDYYKVELPIFVDECSRFSPSNIPSIDGQNVLIFATDDKILKVSYE